MAQPSSTTVLLNLSIQIIIIFSQKVNFYKWQMAAAAAGVVVVSQANTELKYALYSVQGQ